MKRFWVGLCFVLYTAFLMAAESFVISDVRVEGLQRISAGSVFNSLGLRAGDTASTEALAQATKSLFKTGYFSDIKLSRDGEVLVVTVVEQPSVSSITIEGNKAIKTEDLLDGLKKAGLEEGQIFQQATLEGVTLELERQYVAQGKYNAKVKTDVEQQDNNRVALAIHITEGGEAAIRQMNIVGNTIFSDEELLEQFELQPPELLPWYKSAMQYSKEKMNADLEKLRSYYLDQGYINFQIVSTQVSIMPDKKDIYVTVNVSEGAQYRVSTVELSGTLIVSEKVLRKRILVEEGEIFSRVKVTKTSESIARRLGDEGYAFANINPIPDINDEEHTVAINFFVDPGKRAYVRKIEFHGNSKTEDEVLRREMRQFEGAWASTDKINQSKTRLLRLPYIKNVNIETKPVSGAEDQVDVSYTVEEQPSGSLTASIGYSQGNGLLLSSSIQQDNFLGSGKQIGINLSQSESVVNLGFNYLDPYFTDDGISRGYSLYYSITDFGEQNSSDFTNDKVGASVNFGYPFSEIDRLNFSIGISTNALTTDGIQPIEITEYFSSEGSTNNALMGGVGWNRSTLNSATLATRGSKQSASIQMALPLSDVTYYKLEYKAERYKPISDDLTLKVSGSAAYSKAYLNSKYVPFYDHYYAGGLGSVRGFDNNGIGPLDTKLRCLNPPGDPNGDGDCTDTGYPYGERQEIYDGDNFGGNARLIGSIELIFPVPFVKDQKSLQSFVFLDAGSVFNTEYSQDTVDDYANRNLYINNASDKDYGISVDNLRSSFGVGVDWITAFGPVSLSFAKPIQEKDTDDTQIFQFSLGRTF